MITECYSQQEKDRWATEKFGRLIRDNEIVFDVDDREKGTEAINFIAINLYRDGYNFEIWYAEGQKAPHLHIKGIYYLDLRGDALRKYKELILLKYCPAQYREYLDMNMAGKHRIAEEDKPHYKYKTIKKIMNIWNRDNLNWADDDIIELAKRRRIVTKSIDPNAVALKDKVPITLIAQHYGLKVKGEKAVCPFHADKDPSLSLSDKKGLFYCFGCHVGGDLIKFVQMLEGLKNG